MGCGCGNEVVATVQVGGLEVQIDPLALTPEQEVLQNSLPQWSGNKLVNHKAVVRNVTGYHLIKSTK